MTHTTNDPESPDGEGSPFDESTPIDLPESDKIAWLATLAPIEYDRQRKPVAKEMGVQLKTLDALVRAVQKCSYEAPRTPFVDADPYSEPIEPAAVLDEIVRELLRYLIIDPEQACAAALWIAHTYFIDVIDTSPIAIINAPERACAKTLLQTIMATLSYRPLPAANATVSALFRAVELWRPTMFIDEADTFFGNSQDLHGLVNSGYKRGGYFLRSEPTADKSFEPKQYSVYCAKSIAGISLEKHLPDATMSRGIVFKLRRKLPHEKVDRFRNAKSEIHEVLKSKLGRFAQDYGTAVSDAKPVLPEALSDRGQDNWEALFAIASCAGAEWMARAETAALSMSKAAEALVSTGNELLRDIKSVFEMKAVPRLCTADLLDALTDDAEKAWATYDNGKHMTPRQLAQLLEPYNISPKTVRLGPAHTPKGYELGQFTEAFARYLQAPA